MSQVFRGCAAAPLPHLRGQDEEVLDNLGPAMAPSALNGHSMPGQGVRDVGRVEARFEWPTMAWFSDESVEGFFIRPGENVAPAFCAAQVCTIQLKMMDSFLWALLPGDQGMDHLHSCQLGLSLAWSTLTWLLIGFLELGN